MVVTVAQNLHERAFVADLRLDSLNMLDRLPLPISPVVVDEDLQNLGPAELGGRHLSV
jgi:hypothetical protein